MPGVKRNAVHFSPVQFDSQKQKMSSSDTFTQLANQLAAIANVSILHHIIDSNGSTTKFNYGTTTNYSKTSNA
ncbi:unnamed protein product [Meloidogyne enterolobii]|uniref:Uncharacterized protein n=1 Tax=Meloidogyne enterolobii TaxID=390850 RepID=A0ACB0Z9W6_MELEN